jgi:hypothetical protein
MKKEEYRTPQVVEIGSVLGTTFKSGPCCDGSQNFPLMPENNGNCQLGYPGDLHGDCPP